jgi:hypothetical protein
MNLKFYAVQYVENPSSDDIRYVAIIAFWGWRGYYRALGVDGNNTDTVYFQSIAKQTHDSEWVYREWVNWLNHFESIRTIEQFNEAVARLKSNKSGFVVSTGYGEIGLIKGTIHCEAKMDELFKRYVRVPRKSPDIVFNNRVKNIFQQTEIVYEGSPFIEGAEVEMISEESNDVVTLEFSHLMTGNRPVGFNTIVLQGARQKSLALQAERIEVNFRNAVRTGFLKPDRCVLLCGPVKEKHSELIDRFSGIATVIDIFDESTPGKIKAMDKLRT